MLTDYNWERRLRRGLSKRGCSLRKARVETEHHIGILYTVCDKETGSEYSSFTSLSKLQDWYEAYILRL